MSWIMAMRIALRVAKRSHIRLAVKGFKIAGKWQYHIRRSEKETWG